MVLRGAADLVFPGSIPGPCFRTIKISNPKHSINYNNAFKDKILSKQMLDKTVNALISLENNQEYAEAKQILKNRKNLREKLRESLKGKETLSNNSTNYAGLAKTNGRVSWKSVAEELARKYKVPETKLDQITEEYRSNSKRLVYGSIVELKERKGKQLEFEFVTPSYLGDEV